MGSPTRFAASAAFTAVAFAAALWSTPAAAQFKIVNPDGTITYTDRPPQVAPNARITNMARPGSPTVTEPDLSLPADLRQPVARYPVTLYTTSECSPCDAGRQLLTSRGVPYTERQVGTEEDALVFERLFGTRTMPLLTVGSQPLKGLSDVEWGAYLDAAGYPRQSRLPRGWQARVAAMVDRAPAAAPAPARPEAAAPSPAPVVETETVSTGTRIRF